MSMHRAPYTLVIGLAVVLLGAAPLDTAAIVGTSNGRTWEIIVRTDGLTTLYSVSTAGSTVVRTFTLPAVTVQRFFTTLAVAREDDWQSVTCSGAVTRARVAWRGWYSADVTCQPRGADWPVTYHLGLLNNAVVEVIVWAGFPAAVHCYELPKNDQAFCTRPQ